MDAEEAVVYLRSLLGKQLHVHTTDSRIFIGEFKCTDNVKHHPACLLVYSVCVAADLSVSW